jgi:tetratricopeptide (TPR) repeat protein
MSASAMRTLSKILLVLILGGLFFPISAVPSSSLLNVKKKSSGSGETTLVYKYTNKVFDFVYTRRNLKLVKPYIDSAEMACRKENIEIPALLHLARAEYFLLIDDLNNSLQEYAIATKLAENSGDTNTQVRGLNFLGRYNLYAGFFNESIDDFTKSIELAKKSKMERFVPFNYFGISDVYQSMRDTVNYRKTLQILINESINKKDSTLLARGLYGLGSSLILQPDFRLADSLLRQCLKVSKLRNDTSVISSAYANMGYNFYLKKDYKSSIECYNKSLSYSPHGIITSAAANALGNLGTIYRDIGDFEKSIKYYKKSIEQSEKINDFYDLYWVYMDMSKMYLTRKDTGNAYKTYVLYKKYNDAWTERVNMRGLSETKIRYDAQAHKKELELLSLKLSKQKLLIYAYTGLFILSLAIGLLIYSRSRIHARQRISEMNRKISEVTQANLRQQMNPHFIFNTLNSIQYYMYQHDKLATNNYLTKFSSLMRKVLENSQHTSVPLRDELDALTLYLELEKIRFKNKFDYQINIDEEIDTILYKVPTMLIQPYVENSICHGLIPSEEKGLVKIDLKLKKDYISCIIEDNGIGRDASWERKMKNDKNHNSLGTQITNSRLDLVNTLYGTSLKTIYTDLKNESGESVGTRVEIHIPIMS